MIILCDCINTFIFIFLGKLNACLQLFDQSREYKCLSYYCSGSVQCETRDV